MWRWATRPNMTIVRFRFLPAVAALVLVSACGDNDTTDGAVGTGGGPSGGSGGDASTGGGDDAEGEGGSTGAFVEGEPSAPCERYLTCVAATNPAALEQVATQYGADGGCWSKPSLAEACTVGCNEALSDAHQAFPEEERCDVCAVDADCTDPAAPRCGEGECRACVEAADCTGDAAGAFCTDHVCGRDPRYECVAAWFREGFGDQYTAECLEQNCSDELERQFSKGPCAGVDPCEEDPESRWVDCIHPENDWVLSCGFENCQ